MLRIIAGNYRGIRLDEVGDSTTRPTTDKNKESLFNMLGQFFDGGTALDLFAGSGSLGLEAYSRGIEKVTFIDNYPRAIETIEKNIAKFKDQEPDDLVVLKRDALSYLQQKSSVSYDLIFVDPPYKENIYEMILQLIEKNNWLSKAGLIVFESDKSRIIDMRLSNYHVYREKVLGNTKFHFIETGEK